MNFKRPIRTLEERIDRLRVRCDTRNALFPPSKAQLKDMHEEIEEHERSVELLNQIIHISTK